MGELGAVGGGAESCTEADALLLDPVKKAASPDKLGRENTQREDNGEGAGARSEHHDDAKNQKCKSDENFEEPLGLLNCLNNHCRSHSPSQSLHVGCSSRANASEKPQHADFH